MHLLVADPHSDFAMFWPGSSPSEEGEHEGGAETINPYWVSDLQVNLLYFFWNDNQHRAVVHEDVYTCYLMWRLQDLTQLSMCSLQGQQFLPS